MNINWKSIEEWIINFGKTTGLSILEAVGILVLGIIVVKVVLRILKMILWHSRMEKMTVSFLLSILKFVLYIVLVIIVLQSFGISTTWLISIVTAASLAIGLSLQNSLSNLANGLVIISTKPFHEGDFVNIGGVEGRVKNIKMLTTAIITLDNKLVIIPNSTIVTSNVINYNILGKRRCDFTFDVAYDSDVRKVEKIIRDVMISSGKIHSNPAPFVSLKYLQNSSIQFFANCWCDASDYWDLYYYVINNVFNEFKKAGVSIPYNQLEVRLRDDKVTMPVVKDMKNTPEQIIAMKKQKQNLLTNIQNLFNGSAKSNVIKGNKSKELIRQEKRKAKEMKRLEKEKKRAEKRKR